MTTMPVLAAMPLAAGMFMLMMAAARVGVKSQIACQICPHSVIRAAGYAAIERNARLVQRGLRPAADTAADYRVNPRGG